MEEPFTISEASHGSKSDPLMYLLCAAHVCHHPTPSCLQMLDTRTDVCADISRCRAAGDVASRGTSPHLSLKRIQHMVCLQTTGLVNRSLHPPSPRRSPMYILPTPPSQTQILVPGSIARFPCRRSAVASTNAAHRRRE